MARGGSPGLRFTLVDEAFFAAIPAPAQPGARCQTCDYWERLDGRREAPPADAAPSDIVARGERKRSRLLAGSQLAGAYGMLAWREDQAGDRVAVGWAQFGPISVYPRALSIRDRYPSLPESPAPWVITCLQVVADEAERDAVAVDLLEAVCADLDRRGITAVEAYPEGVADPWLPSPGPRAAYEAAGFAHAAGDVRYPVLRRELGSSEDEVGWGDLLARAKPAEDAGEDWPLPLPKGPGEDDLFRLPEKPKRPNPFGDD
jgi:hypothetical protein